MRFGNTKGEIQVKRRRNWGVWWGESATPPSQFWESCPKKKLSFFGPSLTKGKGWDGVTRYAPTWQQLKLAVLVNLCKYSNYKYVYFCILWRLKAFLDPKTSSQRFQEFKFKSILRACKFVCMLAWFVGPKTISRPESFITEVAGDDNSFEMVCFNVISNVSAMALFSTYFANIRKLMSIGTSVLTFLHHWIHLVVKFLKVHRIVSRNGQCSIFSKIVDISVGCLPSQRPRNLQTSTFLFPLSRFWKRDWKQPRSLCVLPPADQMTILTD